MKLNQMIKSKKVSHELNSLSSDLAGIKVPTPKGKPVWKKAILKRIPPIKRIIKLFKILFRGNSDFMTSLFNSVVRFESAPSIRPRNSSYS
jgi:hypothetical protein